MKQKSSKALIISIVVVVVIILSAGGYLLYAQFRAPIEPFACTAEAKICPDGSAVGRAGPNCEFTACPGISNTSDWKTYRNEEYGFEFKYPSDLDFNTDDPDLYVEARREIARFHIVDNNFVPNPDRLPGPEYRHNQRSIYVEMYKNDKSSQQYIQEFYKFDIISADLKNFENNNEYSDLEHVNGVRLYNVRSGLVGLVQVAVMWDSDYIIIASATSVPYRELFDQFLSTFNFI